MTRFGGEDVLSPPALAKLMTFLCGLVQQRQQQTIEFQDAPIGIIRGWATG